MREVEKPLLKLVEEGTAARVNVRMPTGRGSSTTQLFNTGRAIVLLAPFGERSMTLAGGAGAAPPRDPRHHRRARAARPAPGPVAQSGQPLQFVLQGSNYDELAGWRNRLMRALEGNPNLYALDSDYKETQPQVRVEIDHTRARRPRRVDAEIGTRSRPIFGWPPHHDVHHGRRGVRRDRAGRESTSAAPRTTWPTCTCVRCRRAK
jgi:multidrug efflux pump